MMMSSQSHKPFDKEVIIVIGRECFVSTFLLVRNVPQVHVSKDEILSNSSSASLSRILNHARA